MAIVPAQSWAVARDQHEGIEGIVYGFPLWLALALVADKYLETAITRIVQQALADTGWYKNPTTSTVLRGWPVSTVAGAQVDPAISAYENTSFAAGSDGALCIARNHVKYAWAARGALPQAVIIEHRVSDLAGAMQYLRDNAEAARAAAVKAIEEVTLADIDEGLNSERASAKRLQKVELLHRDDDPTMGALVRKRSAPGTSSVLNRFARTRGKNVCLALGGGSSISHAVVLHKWSDGDKDAFDRHGELPFDFSSEGIESRRFVLLLL
ncbi:hypothetical protein CKM354_000350000 [Cercospora kikuchii]|uniref:Uncharacterized protein n=1 Tax=Cercospora kikuchii TaxID=84275 RepID=A0A9P3CC72_9PEZI|nr:uncharacterized protein CKM354_000350000 [Cercospora kikuchii]GIZ40148.1 hypothetical protein CKM354_000350000 [Cercospora kikuchii]